MKFEEQYHCSEMNGSNSHHSTPKVVIPMAFCQAEKATENETFSEYKHN